MEIGSVKWVINHNPGRFDSGFVTFVRFWAGTGIQILAPGPMYERSTYLLIEYKLT